MSILNEKHRLEMKVKKFHFENVQIKCFDILKIISATLWNNSTPKTNGAVDLSFQ